MKYSAVMLLIFVFRDKYGQSGICICICICISFIFRDKYGRSGGRGQCGDVCGRVGLWSL